MKSKGFSLGILIAILIVVGYKAIGILKPSKTEEKADYTLSLLDLDYQPENTPKKVTDASFQLYKNPTDATVTEAKLADYKGKPIILHFWATWCGPCVVELPHYGTFAKNDEIVNIALCSGGDRDNYAKVVEFYKTYSIQNLPIALDVNGGLSRAFGVRGLPTTIFINKEGFEIGRIVGMVDWKDKKVVKLLLNLLQK